MHPDILSDLENILAGRGAACWVRWWRATSSGGGRPVPPSPSLPRPCAAERQRRRLQFAGGIGGGARQLQAASAAEHGGRKWHGRVLRARGGVLPWRAAEASRWAALLRRWERHHAVQCRERERAVEKVAMCTDAAAAGQCTGERRPQSMGRPDFFSPVFGAASPWAMALLQVREDKASVQDPNGDGGVRAQNSCPAHPAT
ncbi:uncharacterized protein LOC111258499 [Setaria italica]|uniref:uncharacterized protein LOC111258499 n=1 Tax=Setaria italica TaxID=4555 RepID=UPI000BE51DDD|nr:uncharacterized protein LOC111258499 [Setaria italica]